MTANDEASAKPPTEAMIAALCARMAAADAVLSAKEISTFNLEVAARALATHRGGTLLMRIPTQKGKPVEFRYEGYMN